MKTKEFRLKMELLIRVACGNAALFGMIRLTKVRRNIACSVTI